MYIPHLKYQAEPHSSPWFSANCAAAIIPRNQFFGLYQQNKSSESKVKFRQASNHCKMVLEAAKLPYATKPKCPLLPRNLALKNFGKLLIVLSKDKSGMPSLCNGPEVLSSVSDKAKLFPKKFSKNSNPDDSRIS